MSTKYPRIWYKSKINDVKRLEENRSDVAEDVANALEILHKKYHWDEAFLFGSITRKEGFRFHRTHRITETPKNRMIFLTEGHECFLRIKCLWKF